MNTRSSFTETTNDLLKNVNFALESLTKINKSLTTDEDSVDIEVPRENEVTGDTEVGTFSIPSYKSAIEKLNSISNAVDIFIEGKGTILLRDGTYREVRTIPIAQSPDNIKDLSVPQKFDFKPEWYSDDFMFPKLYVTFNLKDKIDDRSNRVLVKRVIFDNFDDQETQWFKDNFVGKQYTYYEAIQKLEENNKRYWEDDISQILPYPTNEFTGSFLIKRKETIDGNIWYYLNTLNYKRVSDEPVPKDRELKIGDKLRYGNNAIFKIRDIVSEEKRIRLVAHTGLATPSEGTNFHIYSEPFSDKNVNVNVSEDECNIIFFKGINKDYNIASNNWGESVAFYTNDLTLVNNNNVTFSDYYNNNVFDLAKQFEGMAKEKNIPSYLGVKPDAPSLDPQQMRVTQVNKQINASIDTDEIKSTQSEIENTKTIINSLKETIANQKAELVELTDAAKRKDLQDKINNNISELSKRTSEYQSYVKSLATIADDNNISNISPKYRVRGFFDIPEGKKSKEDSNERRQEIIQFEIAYRYLKLDDTGNARETYTYTDPSTGEEITGTFTDWNIVSGPVKEKVWNSEKEAYEWKNEVVSDGEIVNINQVDIPINKGEKVQLKVRSISEAGWPTNPQKSNWSDRIIIDFPDDLQETNQVVSILEDAQDEETAVKLEETLDAEGVTSHLRDSMPNPNEGDDGTYFKHQAKYLAYNKPKMTEGGDVESQRTVNLQSFLENFSKNSYVTINDPDGGNSKTILLSELLQQIVNNLGSSFYNNL
ncbi:MAG: hypothetical protein ACOCZ5_00950 [bacterium]